MQHLTIQKLFEAGVHYGHKKRFYNADTLPYIYGVRNNQYVINLDKTYPLFLKAIEFVKQLAKENKTLLFVGCKKSAKQFVKEQAIRSGMPYVSHRWMGGTLTNNATIYQSIRKLKDLEKKKDDGFFSQITKKEALMIDRKMTKLENNLGGIKALKGLPDAIFVTDVGKERNAVLEAKHLGIPIIGIVDTNNSAKNIDYIIPGNDDSMRSQKLYCQIFADTILEAQADQVLSDANMNEKSAVIEPTVEVKTSVESVEINQAPKVQSDEPKQAQPIKSEVKSTDQVDQNAPSQNSKKLVDESEKNV